MERTFIDDMNEKFIPALKDMLKKEKDHLWYLMKHKSSGLVNSFMIRSMDAISHYRERIREYEEFVKLNSEQNVHECDANGMPS